MGVLGRLKKKIKLCRGKTKLKRSGVSIGRSTDLNFADLGDFANVAHHAEISNSTIGKRTSIGRFTKIRDANIGSYCSISWNVTIGAVSHPMTHLSSHAFWYRSQFGIVDSDRSMPSNPVFIGNDVWIGCDVVVMPGVKIGDGAVIGANSVVTKDVPEFTVVAGSPAKVLRQRFDDCVVNEIDRIRWWDWSDEVLRQNVDLFRQPISIDVLRQIPSQSN